MFSGNIAILPWWGWGLITSLMVACFLLVNQHYKLKSSTLMLWRGFGVALGFLPLVILTDQPDNPWFYVITISLGILVSLYDRASIHSASQFGAGVTSRLMPLGIWMSFMMWLFLKPSYRQSLIDDPHKLIAVIVALMVAVVAMFFLRKDAISKEAALYLLPFIFVSGILDVFNKVAMNMTLNPIYGAFNYGFWLSLACGVGTVGVRLYEGRGIALKEAFHPHAIKGGLMLVSAMLILMVTKNFAMYETPNPAYVGLLTLFCPIWITLYNRITGHQDKTNLWAGMLFVVSAAVLIAFTN